MPWLILVQVKGAMAHQKFSHSNTLTSTKDTNRVPRALASMNVILQIIYIDLNVIHCTGLCFGMPSNL